MSQRYEKLKNLLQELFQLDQPDLDFGFHRVMHARSAEFYDHLYRFFRRYYSEQSISRRAGQLMLAELQRHFAACHSFAFETALAGAGTCDGFSAGRRSGTARRSSSCN